MDGTDFGVRVICKVGGGVYGGYTIGAGHIQQIIVRSVHRYSQVFRCRPLAGIEIENGFENIVATDRIVTLAREVERFAIPVKERIIFVVDGV